MTLTPSISDDQLVSELWARDVRFLMGNQITPAPVLEPAHLIASLAQSGDARVRLSLIPLFLRHPGFSSKVESADRLVGSQTNASLFLRFYYTAAILLQRKYRERLAKIFGNQPRLPDLFSSRLGILLDENPDQALFHLAERHKILSERRINWLETYEHGAERLIKHMEKFE